MLKMLKMLKMSRRRDLIGLFELSDKVVMSFPKH